MEMLERSVEYVGWLVVLGSEHPFIGRAFLSYDRCATHIGSLE